ncbi:MAG: hypothetical protein AB1742_09750 [bacterium]
METIFHSAEPVGGMELRQETSLRQTLLITPQLLLAQRLLQLPTIELRNEILREINENPALELDEVPTCVFCHRPIPDGETRCPECGRREPSQEDKELDRFMELHTSDYDWEDARQRSYYDGDERSHFPDFISAGGSFHDYLLHNFHTLNYPKELEELGEYLVYSINDDGLLEFDPADARERFGVSDEQIATMISIIQTLEPAGVGARNPREALLIQLAALEQEGKTDPHARRVIAECFDRLGKNRLEDVSACLGIQAGEVRKSLDFIRANLNPYPGRAYVHAAAGGVEFVRPSIVIKYNGKKLTYEVLDLADFRLKINPHYGELYARQKNGDAVMDRDEAAHVKEYIRRAKSFLDGINIRRQTLEKIAAALCQQQRDFLINGLPSFNDSLTQSRLASLISVHESTVSRAMSGKFVRVPSGETLSFDFFFDSSVRPKEYMRNFILNENPENPLTDTETGRLLREKGFKLARRTIAKYREELRIPSSFQRRRSNSKDDGTG